MPGLSETDVLAVLADLRERRRVAATTQTQALSALLFLNRQVLDRPLVIAERMLRARVPDRLPVVFTRVEVGAMLRELSGTHRLIGML